MVKIDEICDDLVKKDGDKYTKEQLSTGLGYSYDSPDKHFFTLIFAR